MNGIVLLIPFLIIRFGLLSFVNKEAVQRAARFAPVQGSERIAYWIYQISNIAIFIYLFFLKVNIELCWQFYTGLVCYLLGLFICSISIMNFSSPSEAGLNTNGIYRFSRNPMYVSYFVCFVGMALLTQSLILLSIVVVFQISSHWIILSEERWCIERFGTSYGQYMKKVRRYI
ncbi:isoprenylcysteine carboxylmethyltransferase family protein [Anaerovorax odorimutans]|uniref:Isoprenylcysteine carboxylmethyltransferase family protein n=1 Tax=Anaerovorax odorimutans TaxID=109327 RepID=A0ABT1RP54_9FIRM|nr:isoprenylcysteine carboxylmethyltransferase family protein [Anaerovorax odorimutans]MCQ4636974.1 isoprenylcysteine carboxylmethyltransferase family protein [Anaerovorax odorimutans]